MELICPECGGLLKEQTSEFRCERCASSYPITDGVIKLSRHPSHWHFLPIEEMNSFLEQIRQLGWREAILSSANPKIKGLYLFTDAPARADGTFYLSLSRESTVLDLGSGWGSYTFALSPRVGKVIAADSNLEYLQLIHLRAEQEGRQNIFTVQIDPIDFGKLPFRDASFDAIIMNGVLEWAASYTKEGDPLRIQENCLKEVRRVLKPDGQLWIGIENRFGLIYLQGAPDDHLQHYTKKPIAYTSVLPRFIADLITRKELGMPYRTYTHSLWGYKRLLKRAGFKRLKFFYPLSGYRAVSTAIYPLDSNEFKRAAKSQMRGLFYWFMSLINCEAVLCDSYFIIATKEDDK